MSSLPWISYPGLLIQIHLPSFSIHLSPQPPFTWPQPSPPLKVGHLAPPWAGWVVIVRDREREPISHFLLQALHEDQPVEKTDFISIKLSCRLSLDTILETTFPRIRNSRTLYDKLCSASQAPGTPLIDLSPYEWNFDLDMPGQKFHHSLKEHHKISNIPKFRCDML
jgi:hypothetical protein